ncbi:MAG: TonB-dependent receptor [Candidatus Latescibacteria bacterium]|nr:TonB-dependent receptor [Candidatus Latescibacterota bacterium]
MKSGSRFKVTKFVFWSVAFAISILHFMTGVSVSQESEGTAETDTSEIILDEIVELEELVVIGSRRPRSATKSVVPIDVVTSEDFVKQGGTDVTDLLRNVIPSYNVNTQPISDAGTVVRPPNLRGLAPDHALVLVNGKRRHRAAVIHWLGNGVADGAQGPDLSAIPAIALKRVEVLRDGASAQYGSDAIAGVLDFRLKNNHEGMAANVKVGSFQDGDGKFLGDGEMFTAAFNIGLGDENTWANLSLEYGNTGETIRSVQRNDAAGLISAGNIEVANPAQVWGQPFVRDDLKIFANYGATLGESVDFYGHANYADKETEGGFYFRNPHTRSGVFKGPLIDLDGDGEAETASLLVGDLDGLDQGGECPPVPIIDNRPDQNAWLQVRDDPNCFSFLKMFPGGFTPRFGAFTTDESILMGIKGTGIGEQALASWDLSMSYGRHEADYFIFNTVNASMGPATPTYFDPGSYIQSDVNLDFGVTYPVNPQVFLAAGLEYRKETFEIVEGQIESYIIGQPLASQGFQPATNGFSGFSKVAAGRWSRYNTAVYAEGDIQPTDRAAVSVALRYENFEDFGATSNYKVATNIGLSENARVRGSYSTGFRAPTPGQQNAFNITTEFNFEKNDLVNNGTVPSTSRAAALKGAKALAPEKSKNLSLGVVLDMGKASMTVDYFDIRVNDRLTVSQDFSLSDAEREQLIREGITSAAGLQEFRFFTNDFNTQTQGIDVVFSVPLGLGAMNIAYNYTGTKVTDHNPEILDDLRLRELEENLPKQRGNLTLTQKLTTRWDVLGRISYFGEWYDSEDDQVYSGKVLFDAETSVSFDDYRSTIAIGAQNIFNTYPDEHEKARDRTGNKYSQFSPFGFGGAFWYAKYSFNY